MRVKDLERYVTHIISYRDWTLASYGCPVFFGRFMDAVRTACAKTRQMAGLDGHGVEAIQYAYANRPAEIVEADDLYE